MSYEINGLEFQEGTQTVGWEQRLCQLKHTGDISEPSLRLYIR
jgi:hypothetical protein